MQTIIASSPTDKTPKRPIEIYLDRAVAVAIGLEEDILLESIDWYCSCPNRSCEFLKIIDYENGTEVRWARIPLSTLEFCHPYWKKSKIHRLLHALEDQGLIQSTTEYNKNQMDRTKWYSLTEKGEAI